MNYVVCGPPGSGKSTFVQNSARFGDLIVDLDEIFRAISGLPMYEKPETLLPFAIKVKNTLIDAVAAGENKYTNAWIITSGSSAKERDYLARRLRAKVYVFEVSAMTCARRISKDDRRKDKVQLWMPIIEKWWREYRRRDGDVIIDG